MMNTEYLEMFSIAFEWSMEKIYTHIYVYFCIIFFLEETKTFISYISTASFFLFSK